jgi:hypothetical protein
MEKIIIHTVTVSKAREKILFQILLPENAEAIIGIATSCDRYKIYADGIPNVENTLAGILRLNVSDTGDKFFSQSLHGVAAPPSWQTIGENFSAFGLWSWKGKFEFFDTNQKTENTIIDGFYQDSVGEIMTTDFIYNVRIYLKLKLKEK